MIEAILVLSCGLGNQMGCEKAAYGYYKWSGLESQVAQIAKTNQRLSYTVAALGSINERTVTFPIKKVSITIVDKKDNKELRLIYAF